MRILSFLLLVICSTPAFAQHFKFPVVPVGGKTIKSLVPPQWKVLDSVRGDLNNDRIEDLALVFEFYARVKEDRAYGDSTTELITETQRPRILAVYFHSGRNYKLVTQNNNFILRSEEGGQMGDPFRPMSIQDNKLNLFFEGGGNWKWKLNYSFAWKNREWQLLNAGNYAYHSASGEVNNKQYDFVNMKRTVTILTGNKESSKAISQSALDLKTLRTFSSFKKPWTWEIGTDEYL